jgi:FkbM family methyltransferase
VKQVHGWWFPDHEVHLPEWMSHPKNQLQMNGRQAYQGRKQQAVLAHCKSFRTAIDVGGHVGLWSFNLAARFEHVDAFEPVSEHRECFRANVQAKNVTLWSSALGDEGRLVSMSTEKGSSGNTCVSGPGDIEMTTLDMRCIEHVDLIKIDCEGFEEKVVRGGRLTIEQWRPVIIVEQKRDMAARFGLPLRGAVDFVVGLGYRVAEEISGDFIMVPA